MKGGDEERADRPGPLFGGIPWASVATFYNATLAISAALRAREVTGRGQHVHTSLLQGVLATTVAGWQFKAIAKANFPEKNDLTARIRALYETTSVPVKASVFARMESIRLLP